MNYPRKEKGLALILVLAVLLTLGAGAAFAEVPTISSTQLYTEDGLVLIGSSERAYGNAEHSEPVEASDFALEFQPNGGTVTGITVTTQPTLEYTMGETLDLSRLKVTLTYNDEPTSTLEVVYEDFSFMDITTDPVHGATLSVASHHGQPVEITCNGQTAYTGNLTVTSASSGHACQIGTTGYTTLEAALIAAFNAEGSQTIKLLQPIEVTAPIIVDGRDITFNLNGNNLTVDTSAIPDSTALKVIDGGSVSLEDDSAEFNVIGDACGVEVEGTNSSATVTNAAGGIFGAHATNGEITVKQDAAGTGAAGTGARAMAGGKITVGDDVTGVFGAYATGTSSSITIDHDVTATGEGNVQYGVVANGANATVAVAGNVTANNCVGAAAAGGGKVQIEGTLTAPAYYVKLGGIGASEGIFKSPMEYEKASIEGVTEDGYHTYYHSGSNSRVLVDAAANPLPVPGDSVPTAPQDFTATPGNEQVTLNWTAPASQGGSAIIGYQVSNNNGANWVTAATNTGHTFTGLTNGTAYTFQVRAVNSDGEGTPASVTATPVAATGAAVWNYRSPLPAANLMESAEYLNGQYMAVGYNGTLITSPDGETWQKVNVGTDTDRLTDITYGNGKYVIVATASDYVARIYTSGNGLDWHETAAVPHHWLYGVAYGDDGFVAVGQSGKILISEDGENWDVITVDPMDYTLLSITYADGDGDGKYVATGMRKHTGITQHGAIMTSENGVAWEVTHTDGNNILWDIAYAGTFVAVGGASTGSYYICTSSDGVTWTQRSNYGSAYAQLFSVTYDSSKFIAVGNTNSGGSSGPNKAFVTTSVNGIDWTDRTDTTKSGLRVVVSDANNYRSVVMGGTGNIYTSDDGGASWIYQTLGTTKTLRDVAWNGSSLYVAVGDGGTIQTSPDGESWTIQTSGTANDLMQVDYLNGQFIAVGASGTILTSDNGTDWTLRASGTTRTLKDIAFGGGEYIVVGGDSSSNPVILSSDTGAVWSSTTTGFINRSFITVAYGNGAFLALMQYGQVYRSDDGTGWTEAPSLPGTGTQYPTDIIYAGGKFAAVGGYGKIYLTSDNGDNWTTVQSDLTQDYLLDITYGNGNFAVVANNGKIIASADGGTTWFLQPSGLTPNPYFSLDQDAQLHGITAGGGSFVAVGGNGVTLQSGSFSISTDPDAHDVAIAKSRLFINNILGSGSNYNEDNIVANMSLADSWEKDTTVSWTSSKPGYIAESGTVTRPSFGDGDQVVYLTATISKGSVSVTKTFIVNVIAYPDPDIQIVEQAVAALTFDVIKESNTAENNIRSNLNLITDGGNGTSVSWQSNKTDYIAIDGTVTRPAQGTSDQVVTLTATVSKGTVTRTRTFYLTVKVQLSPDDQAVADDRESLTFDAIKGSNTFESDIMHNLNLISSGGNGTSISWASNKPQYIDPASGAVTRPVGEYNESVTLTATISKGSASATRTFYLAVKAWSVWNVVGITIQNPPNDLIYTAGEALDLTGLAVTLTYNDATSLDVGYEDFSYMGVYVKPSHGTVLTAANHHGNPITVTCNGQTAHTGNLTVTTATRVVTGIIIKTQPTDLTYTAGETLDLSGLVITLTYSDETTLEVDYEDFSYMGITANPAHGDTLSVADHHDKPVTVTCNGKTASTDNLTVTEPEGRRVTGIAIKTQPTNLTYKTGQNLSLEGLVVTLTYSDETTLEVGYEDFIYMDIAANPAHGTTMAVATHHNQPVIVTCNGQTAATNNLTVTSGSSGGNSGGSSNPPAPVPAPVVNAVVAAGNTPGTTLPVHVSNGTGTISLEASSAEALFGGEGTALVTVPSIAGVRDYTLEMPASTLSGNQGGEALTLSTEAGSITLPGNMLLGGLAAEAQKVGITLGQGDKSLLPEDVREALGDRPLIRLSLAVDGRQTSWNNENTPVTVSIPYTPTPEELANPESIVVWYIDGSGNTVSVPNGRYDPAIGTVTFATTHFSYYAVGYNQVGFKDVAAEAWYGKAVAFLAAREIATGTGNGNFNPEEKLTRGQFIVMLMKAYGTAPDEAPKDNFADAGNTYYTGYLAAAKRLGISAGVGNNLFVPEKEITRQEMFTLLYNGLKTMGKLPQGNSEKSLSAFSDAGDIAPWAKDAMTLFAETGIIGGSGGKFAPADTTTRAQMAQVLYNLLSK